MASLNDEQKMKVKHVTEQMMQEVYERTKSTSHSDFVKGLKDRTLFYEFVSCQPSQFIHGKRKSIFKTFVFLYALVPIIIIPLIGYYMREWWILLAIVFSYTASFSAARNWNVIFLITSYCIGAFLGSGFQLSLQTAIFFISALWGYIMYQMAEESQKFYANEALVENTDLYNNAIAQNKIIIINLDQKWSH